MPASGGMPASGVERRPSGRRWKTAPMKEPGPKGRRSTRKKRATLFAAHRDSSVSPIAPPRILEDRLALPRFGHAVRAFKNLAQKQLRHVIRQLRRHVQNPSTAFDLALQSPQLPVHAASFAPRFPRVGGGGKVFYRGWTWLASSASTMRAALTVDGSTKTS